MGSLDILVRNSAPLTAALALVSWAIALGEALPRLLTGPLCASGQDGWAFAGHCPACYAAVALTLAAITLATRTLAARRRLAHARAAQAI